MIYVYLGAEVTGGPLQAGELTRRQQRKIVRQEDPRLRIVSR